MAISYPETADLSCRCLLQSFPSRPSPFPSQYPTLNFRPWSTPHLHLQIAILPTRRKPTITSITRASSPNTDQNSLASIIFDVKTQGVHDQEEEEEEEEEQARGKAHEDGVKLAERWREIHGDGDWAGLLDPMDPLLRSELVRYGEMAQACYDAFDYDPCSRYCGSSKYHRRRFFESLGMPDAGYEVTRYLYATSSLGAPNFFRKSQRTSHVWSEAANWIGFVAVSDDATSRRLGRRDIVIAWRGTVTKLEWVADLMDYLVPFTAHRTPAGLKVESGFLNVYTAKDETCRFCKYSARDQILAEVRRLVQQYSSAEQPEELSITVTGHSLGAALAVLSAYDIAAKELNRRAADGGKAPVAVFSFAGPRVGNGHFKEAVEAAGVRVLRVVNVHDSVPKVPGLLVNERVPTHVRRMVGDWLPWSYSHVGVELVLDHRHSPFLKDTVDPSCFHNLEAHLHLLDGYHGKGQRFMLSSGRDIALVNKASDFLKDHHLVPSYWRQDENKGMIRGHDGRWIQPDRPHHDDHPPDIHHHLQQIGLHTSSFPPSLKSK